MRDFSITRIPVPERLLSRRDARGRIAFQLTYDPARFREVSRLTSLRGRAHSSRFGHDTTIVIEMTTKARTITQPSENTRAFYPVAGRLRGAGIELAHPR